MIRRPLKIGMPYRRRFFKIILCDYSPAWKWHNKFHPILINIVNLISIFVYFCSIFLCSVGMLSKKCFSKNFFTHLNLTVTYFWDKEYLILRKLCIKEASQKALQLAEKFKHNFSHNLYIIIEVVANYMFLSQTEEKSFYFCIFCI